MSRGFSILESGTSTLPVIGLIWAVARVAIASKPSVTSATFLIMTAVSGSNSRGTRSRATQSDDDARIRGRSSQALHGIHERGFVADVEASFRAINLAHQSAENFSRSNFNKSLHALRDQQAYAGIPLHRAGDLAD